MPFHEPYRQQFLQKASSPLPTAAMAPEQPTAAVATYDVRLEPAQVAPGQLYWRLIGIHHLTPDENRGGHSVYVDVVDEAGERVKDSSLRLRWGWEGQRPDEAAPARAFDKPSGEPATNVDLYLGQRVWVEVEEAGLASDRVANLHSKHSDEAGPNGELWNSIGHHSFYLVFQRSRATATSHAAPTPVAEIPTPVPPPTPATSPAKDDVPPSAPAPMPATPAIANRPGSSLDFVRVQRGEFFAKGRPLRFIGVNIRGLVHYGDGRTLPYATRDHAREQIRAARAMGARVIRVFLPSIHADTQSTIERLRDLIERLRAEAPDVYLLPALCNLYQDVEFRIPGDDGFYARIDPDFPGNLLNAAFFKGGYRTNYLPFVQQVVQAFGEEPMIFAWEIGNELKLNPVSGAPESDPNVATFLDFMHSVAQEIRRIDPNHLVTTGMISTHHAWLHTPALRHKLYAGPDFDFITVHCYNDERENDDSDLARELGKPFIVEEAGYGLQYGSDRSPKAREDMAIWFGKDARGYMPWGFMATSHDIGDGDRDSGLDRTLHGDWEPLFSLFRSQAETLAQQIAQWQTPEPADTTAASSTSSTPSSPPEPTTAFEVNQVVYSTDWLNIRKSPGHLHKLGDDILGMFAPAQPATITGAAVAKDELIWWPVRVKFEDGQTVDGWAAEANANMRLLSAQRVQARTVAGIEARRSATQLLYVTTYVNLRHAPGYVGKATDDLIGQIPYGARVELTGSAVMADELSWLPVRAPLLDNSVATGWAAEVDPDGIELLSTTPPEPPVTNVGGVIGAAFQPGAMVTLLGVTHLHAAAGLSTREVGALTSLLPNGTVTIVGGPEIRGDIEWWQTTQQAADGEALSGWAALTSDDGTRLLAASGVAQQIYAARPFAEQWLISQGWGLNPQVYSTIPYDGVPLKGHNGLDFATPVGTPLLATDAGQVLRVDYEHGGFGHFVLLQHAWGESLYAHLERVDVLQGATVARGQTLGLSGNSGFSSGPHLHFGLRIYPYRRTDGWGGFVNPMPFLRLEDVVFGRGRGRAHVDRAIEWPGWRRP